MASRKHSYRRSRTGWTPIGSRIPVDDFARGQFDIYDDYDDYDGADYYSFCPLYLPYRERARAIVYWVADLTLVRLINDAMALELEYYERTYSRIRRTMDRRRLRALRDAEEGEWLPYDGFTLLYHPMRERAMNVLMWVPELTMRQLLNDAVGRLLRLYEDTYPIVRSLRAPGALPRGRSSGSNRRQG
jgi:hypothetical protein